MKLHDNLTRRALLGTSVTTAAVLGLKIGQTGSAKAQSTLSGKVTYWGGLIFSEDANKLLKSTITTWGDEIGRAHV